jgi:lactoylglutathione lyase
MQYLHTMMRVKDLDKSIEFYTKYLGMKVLRRTEYPEGKFTNTFLGYDDDPQSPQLELTYNWGREEPYELGEAWGHIALGVKDIYKTCAELEAAGCPVPRKPGPMKHGTTVIAFIRDPDNHSIELIEMKD